MALRPSLASALELQGAQARLKTLPNGRLGAGRADRRARPGGMAAMLPVERRRPRRDWKSSAVFRGELELPIAITYLPVTNRWHVARSSAKIVRRQRATTPDEGSSCCCPRWTGQTASTRSSHRPRPVRFGAPTPPRRPEPRSPSRTAATSNDQPTFCNRYGPSIDREEPYAAPVLFA